ncbi:hypothetical protein [Hydrogenophaga sp.]|uniref:hypothetical protein n=1 Tax=Hydrogenophaga sp. TaxID=1904254 RepID=UPI003563C9C7
MANIAGVLNAEAAPASNWLLRNTPPATSSSMPIPSSVTAMPSNGLLGLRLARLRVGDLAIPVSS